MCLRHPATGKEDCAWPLYFPSSGPRGAPRPSRVKIGRGSSVGGGYFQTSWREALHGGQGAGPGEAFEANVDSLHILREAPRASRKMLCSLKGWCL